MSDQTDAQQFSFKVTRDNTLFVYWQQKLVRTYQGSNATKLIARLNEAETDVEQQMILAKATGNFKRGNER